MKPFKTLLFTFFLTSFLTTNYLVAQTTQVNIKVHFDDSVADDVKDKGRLFLFMTQDPRIKQPRTQTWPNPMVPTYIFAKNFEGISASSAIMLNEKQILDKTPDWSLENIPLGKYFIQVLWDQDFEESRIDAPGNLFSETIEVTIEKVNNIELTISEVIPSRAIVEHELVKEIDLKSDTLSNWWGKPVHLKATILLPPGFDESKGEAYPIRYNVAGYGGRYTRINYIANNKEFMQWWTSDEAPRVINVFLDGEGPFGDSYQMDSENSGPYGYALTEELIPHIEQQYRGTQTSEGRYVDGCSTGGWVSLGLQLYYPEVFDGVFSYSPDAIEFENYQLINIYKDENAYYNETGYLRPVMRDISGEPMLSLKDFIQYENVLGYSGTYLNSGGQFSAHTALYSPKGDNGLPKPIFDPVTGTIDHEVAEHWQKYDFKKYVEKNWEELAPKIEGKIYVWMGDMDHFYLNPATRAFSEFLETLDGPKSDAVIEFTAMKGHCAEFSNQRVLEQIQEKLKE